MFLGPALKDEVLKIMPVQKQTRAGQRTRWVWAWLEGPVLDDELLRIPNLNFFGDHTMAMLTNFFPFSFTFILYAFVSNLFVQVQGVRCHRRLQRPRWAGGEVQQGGE